MQSAKEGFFQFQEAEYYQSDGYGLKSHIILPALKKKVAKPKGNATTTNIQN